MLTKDGAYGNNHHRIDHQLQKEEKDIVKPTSYRYEINALVKTACTYTLVYILPTHSGSKDMLQNKPGNSNTRRSRYSKDADSPDPNECRPNDIAFIGRVA